MNAVTGGSRLLIGTVIELQIERAAHGGICVAHHDGQVVFVRHALPGERVRARVTEQRASYLRAEVTAVLQASPDRVTAPCVHAGRCGGCDWQHVGLEAQRRIKAGVIVEQMSRLAHLDVAVRVEEVPGDHNGLGWRTRVRYTTDDEGRAGFHHFRSHMVEPIDRCLIARPAIQDSDVTTRRWSGGASIDVAESGDGSVQVQARREDGTPVGPSRSGKQSHVRMRALDRDWRVSVGGFWQVHPGAGDALVAVVMEGLQVRAGEQCVDLYAGAGLFAFALAEATGPTGHVMAIESDVTACRDARRNLHAEHQVEIVNARVDAWLRESQANEANVDVVVLDPPRAGAGPDVVAAVSKLKPRAIAYVSCDPAALARDAATFGAHGYDLGSLRAFDIFPMTHHVECVAILVPAEPATRDSRG